MAPPNEKGRRNVNHNLLKIKCQFYFFTIGKFKYFTPTVISLCKKKHFYYCIDKIHISKFSKLERELDFITAYFLKHKFTPKMNTILCFFLYLFIFSNPLPFTLHFHYGLVNMCLFSTQFNKKLNHHALN